MLFNSVAYILILPAVLLINRLIPKRYRYLWMLVCSGLFYYSQGSGFVMLLAVSAAVTYIAGLAIAYTDSRAVKKITASAAVVAGVLILFLYKYLDFTLELFRSPLRLDLAVPLGISFYTFMAVSYITDVYRDAEKVEKDPLKLALFLSFFPSIVSGPINRANDVIPQMCAPEDLTFERTKRGMQKMLWGYFLKLAIAGRLAIVVDNVYANSDAYPGFSIAFTALAYLFMLYCDFEGYSQIVIGSAYMLGITMKENFRQPFMSQSMQELWRRWHVSLSGWFRDYMYIPLGGNRHGTVRKYINVFIVLLVSGIWHGANMTFVIWGALNGAYIIIGQLLIPYRDRLAERIRSKLCGTETAKAVFDRVRAAAKTVGVYLFSSFTFIFFANKDVTSAWYAVRGILTRFSLAGALSGLTQLGLGTANLAAVLVLALFVLVADHHAAKRSCDTPSLIKNIPVFWRWVIYYALIIAILFSANLTGKEFIYSRM